MSKVYTNGTKTPDKMLESEAITKENKPNHATLQQVTDAMSVQRRANRTAQHSSNIFASAQDSSAVDGARAKPTGKPYIQSNIFANVAEQEPITPRRANKPMGNPITGEGYGNNASEVGQEKDNQKRRQQPQGGGFSSKLW